jgi:hypothetical protein
MSFKTTYILFAVLGGMLGLIVLAVWLAPGDKDVSKYVLPSLHGREAVKTDDINIVEIERAKPKKETLVFERDPNTKKWKLEKPNRLRVDNYQVDRIVKEVFDAGKYEMADLTSDLKDWDLDPPLAVVTIKKGIDQEWSLNLGRQREGQSTGVVYVTSSDQPKEPMAVKRSELDQLFKSVVDFRSKDMLTESALNIQAVKLQKAKGTPVALEKKAERRWRFTEPAEYGLADYEGEATGTTPDLGGVHGLLDSIEKIRVESDADFVDDNATDLAKYGLEENKPELLRIEISQRVGSLLGGDEKQKPVSDALLIGKKVEVKEEKKPEKKAEKDKENPKKKDEKDRGIKKDKKEEKTEDKYYARLESETAIVKIPAKSLDPILKVLNDHASLRNRDLVQNDQLEWRTDAIDIQNASGPIKLRKPKSTWEVFAGNTKGKNADDQAVQGAGGLIGALKAKRQVEFPEPIKETELAFDKPLAVVSLWLDGIQKEEKKDEKKVGKPEERKDEKKQEKKEAESEPKLKTDKPTVKLTFGKKDKWKGQDVVYVRREAEDGKDIAAVPVSVLEKVDQKPLAYLERIIPTFSERDEVTKLVIERDGQTYEVDKEKKDEKSEAVWKLKKPADAAGRNADAFTVFGIISDLRQLKPDKLETEKASDAELEKYGLKSPKVKATITVQDKDKKTEDWVYLFGKEEKTGLHAKEGKHDLVFLVQPSVLKVLQHELLDPTVFHFDPAKVKAVKMEGWKKAQGFLVTLQLERKDAKSWTAKAPADFDLDSDAVNTLIADLANLKAERFVVRKSGPKPEHELGNKERALQIEITLEGEKNPLTLTIGKLDEKEKGYDAQSSALPGDVFLLPQFLFEKRLSGVKLFSKNPPAAK